MDGGAVVGLVFVLILAIALGVVLQDAQDTAANRTPLSLAEMAAQAQLAHGSNWNVVVMRRSGYVHGAWTVSGDRRAALDFATSKMRQARIDTVAIVKNEPRRLEVVAYYESTGHRRTGKYVGGVVITPA